MGGLPQGSADNFPPDENFAAIPVKINGINSSALGLYSQSFEAGFSSLVFGGEFNVYFNPIVPKEYGLLFRPMLGFRYMGIQEDFNVAAQNPGVATTTIFSRTISNLYGPQAGFRLELVTQWFTIGADPRVMVGVNQFASSVDSFDPTLGGNSDYISTARFSAVGAIDAYVKIPIHDRVKLYAAYNLFVASDISRPQSQIDYNVNESSGGVFTNDIHLNLSHDNLVVDGFSVGLEFNF
jgi:Putative beta barrel porin-7 (BBP7)